MDFWPEFVAKSWGREFVAGGMGGMAGVISGYPLDTLRIRLQQPCNTRSATSILRSIVSVEGPLALYKGMGAPLASVTFQRYTDNPIRTTNLQKTFPFYTIAPDILNPRQPDYTSAPLASVTFQNAMVFQVYAVLSRAFYTCSNSSDPPSYKSVALGGFGTGALQSFLLSPVELVKIRLQLQPSYQQRTGPLDVAKRIFKTEGLKGMYRGLTITILRDAPAHSVYFWTYEYTREKLHPGCRKNGDESLKTMLVAGGSAGVASWVCCYPLDVIKSRLQGQSQDSVQKYKGIVDCFRKSVGEEGYSVLCRGLGTAVTRAFLVNGAVFAAYEITLRCLFNNNNNSNYQIIEKENKL